MKKYFLFSTLLMFTLFSHAQDSAWIRNNYYKKEVYIPMRDGVKLFTSLYIPKDNAEKHPILITRTPYSCAPYGENEFSDFWGGHYKSYMKEKYIMVIQDVRGTWMSEGVFEDLRPFIKNKKSKKDIDEASDTYDTIDWLIKNITGNNGKVGVLGTSYPGFYATMAAACGHPALKAVSPQAPVTDWFMGDDWHHNGALSLIDATNFYAGFGKPRPAPTTVGAEGFTFSVSDNYAFYLNNGPIANIVKLMDDSSRFIKEMFAHPDYDEWWKARNARVSMYNIQPAVLVVGGTFDAEDGFGAWNSYKAIKNQSPQTNCRLVMGPWYHGQWNSGSGTHLGNIQFGENTAEYFTQHIEIPFFNYYLKGIGNDSSIKGATVFFSGENKWHQTTTWPPQEMKMQPYYFQSNGHLTTTMPSAQNSFTEYTSDPAKPVPYAEGVHLYRTKEYMTDDQRFAARRPDVLLFETDVLNKDLTLGGPVIADLKISINTTDADFVVKVIDVFPDDFKYSEKDIYPMGGYQMMIRGEIMRGKYRNSFEKPEAFEPGKPTQIRFTLPDVAHTFKKGHKLMIQVQSSWFPLMDRNPQKFTDIYTAKETDFQKSVIRIYHDKDNASSIVLPILN
ncbi:MAG: CocE/NonD family hydrolase [Agriterribacter sp.]